MDKTTIEDKRQSVHPAPVHFYSQLIYLEQTLEYKRVILQWAKISTL